MELSEYDISTVCRITRVSRSAYYYVPNPKDSEEIELEKAVVNCYKKNRGNYGRIRIKKALERKGIRVSENRIARILRENGLKAKSGRTGKRNSNKPCEEQYIEENLIKDKFSIKTPNYLWCSDITELECHEGRFYLCGIIDVAPRSIVGWSIKRHQRQDIVQEAFEMAVGKYPNRPEEAVYHSDRGCQYTAKRTKELVEKYGFRKSMSRPGTPSDNQPIESFWTTLARELPDIKNLSFEEASRVIVEYIELYYNSERLHSGIGYEIPNEYSKKLAG